MPATSEPSERLRRTWPQRLLIGFNLMLILGCLTSAGAIGYFYYQFGQLPRITFSEGVITPDPPPGEPQNYLLVGSDSRAFVDTDQEASSFGDSSSTGGQRSDTIILVRVDPKAKRAAMVSFPRDLWIPIAPDGHEQRINTAFTDGPEQLIETIKLNYNVPIHHYMQVDFAGFQGLVDAVGGVEIYLPGAVRDRYTGLNITDTGCVLFHGDQALAYARSRHFEYQEDGRWREDPRGDLGRIERQQDFIRRALRKALSSGLTSPSKLNRMVGVGIENVAVDRSLSARDIVNLGKQFKSLTPDTLAQFQIPVVNANRNGASVVVVPEDQQHIVDEIMNVFRGAQPASDVPLDPSGATIRVLNGSGRAGEAGATAERLQVLGFQIGAPGNSPVAEQTTISYGSGQRAKAELLDRYLASSATLIENSDIHGVDVVLVTGRDFKGVLEAPRPASASSSTTTPTAITTPPATTPDC